jgi:hypothetical protein
MHPKFVSFVVFEDRIYGFSEWGDVWQFMPPHCGHYTVPTWTLVSDSPWPVPEGRERAQIVTADPDKV